MAGSVVLVYSQVNRFPRHRQSSKVCCSHRAASVSHLTFRQGRLGVSVVAGAHLKALDKVPWAPHCYPYRLWRGLRRTVTCTFRCTGTIKHN